MIQNIQTLHNSVDMLEFDPDFALEIPESMKNNVIPLAPKHKPRELDCEIAPLSLPKSAIEILNLSTKQNIRVTQE